MDSSRNSTNPRYYNQSEYSSLNAKHRELRELELASPSRGRSRTGVAEEYQDVTYARRDLESSVYTPVTGRTKKGIPAHTCDICKPAKTFTKPEHLRRHQLSHQKPAYRCTFEDCERAFHRLDLLSRHLHRHETQGEKAYKSGDPRGRASSSASESRTPSLKEGTLSQGGIPTGPQISSRDSMMHRMSGSRESSLTTSSVNTIVTNFQAINRSPGPPSKVKQNGQSYSKTSTGGIPSRWPGNSDQTSFFRPEDSARGFSEGGSTQLSGYTTTPRLPLLHIPELSYTSENSPWVSSDSESTYSTQSEGPRNPRAWGRVMEDSIYSPPPDEPQTPLDKFAETFKKMERKAWKSSAKISGISPTISKDNTSGECARQAKLFAEFGRKKSCAFASSFAQHYDEGNDIDNIINRPGNGH